VHLELEGSSSIPGAGTANQAVHPFGVDILVRKVKRVDRKMADMCWHVGSLRSARATFEVHVYVK
jgi:hypothetical protein